MDTTILLKQYLAELKKEIPNSYGKKKELLTELEASVSLYMMEHPNCTYADLLQEFGNPNEIADTLLQSDDTQSLRHSLRTNARLRILMVLLIVFFFLGSWYVVDHASRMANEGYIEFEEHMTEE